MSAAVSVLRTKTLWIDRSGASTVVCCGFSPLCDGRQLFTADSRLSSGSYHRGFTGTAL